MTDRFQTLLADCIREHSRFSHAAHLHLAWLLLEETSVLHALAQFHTGVRTLADAAGQSEKYNATLTTAYFLLLLERREPGQTWEAFAAGHADLLDWTHRDRLITPFYENALLQTPAARQACVMPSLPNA